MKSDNETDAKQKSEYLGSAREHCRSVLLALAQSDSRIVCLDSDMGGLDALFHQALGDRYIDVGIAEANLMSIAAGLAKGGLRPVAHTMATFAATRACEQIKLDIAHHNLPVVIVASHAGLSAGHYGPTHFSIEDLAILRSFPNMTVVVPCDAREAGRALKAALNHDGPVYIRLGRQATPLISSEADPFSIGKANWVRTGRDVIIFATGPIALGAALAAADLTASTVSVGVINMSTLKPLDVDTIRQAAQTARALVTVEEHTILGGLGGAVCEVVCEFSPKHVIRVGLPDRLPDRVDEEHGLLAQFGISPQGVRDAVLRAFQVTS